MLEYFGVQLLACSLRSQEKKLPTHDYNMVLRCFFNDSQTRFMEQRRSWEINTY